MIRVRQVKLPIADSDLTNKVSHLLRVHPSMIKEIQIIKKSLDARKKDNLLFVHELDVLVEDEDKILKRNLSKDIFKSEEKKYQFKVSGIVPIKKRPVIVGAGPAGLYCAYFLAEHGFSPLIIERGEKVEDRVKTVEEFWKGGTLDSNSNVQFGEGGAGTFSDGKLNTSIKDRENRIQKVLEIFVENGAPKEILYEAKPHIGTDVLRNVVRNIRNRIISWGGEFRYHTTLTNLEIHEGKITSIELNYQEKIDCDTLVLAIGHSARDTFRMLYDNKLSMTSKPFAVGVRIEHPQKMINKSQYGVEACDYLPPASYKVTYTTKEGRGVYSFCMCPGGYVVNASSEEEMLVVNGMSNYRRESRNANSALVVTVNPRDFGESPLDGIAFQRTLEKAAYRSANGKIPIQLYKDFKDNVVSTDFGEVIPCTKGEYSFVNLNDILPIYITDSLKEAIEVFGKTIDGYNRGDALLLGVESRTSSPVRIVRNEEFVSNIEGIYPCGEGAGYAGGITTSCIDGMKVAEAIARKYHS